MKMKSYSVLFLASLFSFSSSSLVAFASESNVISLPSQSASTVQCPASHLATAKRTDLRSIWVECKALDMKVSCSKHVMPTELVDDYDQGGSYVRNTYKGILTSPLGTEEFIGYRNNIDEALKPMNARAQELQALGICKKFVLTIEE